MLCFSGTTQKFHIKDSDCWWQAFKKEITVVLFSSITEAKIKPLVIGKFNKPIYYNTIIIQ
jgi:hypothetical protein